MRLLASHSIRKFELPGEMIQDMELLRREITSIQDSLIAGSLITIS